MFSSEAWLSNSSDFYNGVATQSLRLNGVAENTTLYRDLTATGNRRTATISFWMKNDRSDAVQYYWSKGDGGGVQTSFQLFTHTDSTFSVYAFNSDSQILNLRTNRVFRDASAWYHFVVAVDTTQATASDRVKLYINGVQETSFSTASYMSQNTDTVLGLFSSHKRERLGDYQPTYTVGAVTGGSAGNRVHGYFSDFYYIDGSQLDPTSFGEFKNGVWIPIEYTGSYGTNGYRLEFKQTGTGTASSTTIGADTSGNDNHWTTSNVSAEDSNISDCPENNMCTFNSVGRRYGQSYVATFSEGNLKAVGGGNATNVFGSMAINQIASQGGVYFEIRMDSLDTARTYFGVVGDTGKDNKNLTSNSGGYTFPIKGMINSSPRGYFNTATDASGSLDLTANTGFSNGDVAGIAILSDGKFFCHRNGTYLQNASGNVGNPSTGANPIATIDLTLGDWVAYVGYNSSFSINFGQDGSFGGNETSGGYQDANGIGDFMFAVPTSCLAICSSNMAEPTISPNTDNGTADDYFNTATYSGNSSTQNITSVGFQPDWVWIKSRSNASNHYLTDVVRGTSKGLQTNISNAEVTNTNVITSFNSDGFSLGDDATANVANITGRTYVAWNWKAGGTAVSNTDGSITSSVSANTDAGFSIVSFTGNGSNDATIGHGLGTTPAMIITKNRDDSVSWRVWHQDLTSTYVLLLDSTVAETAPSGQSNGYIKTVGSSTYSVYQGNVDTNGVNGSGDDMIAYCFAEIEGYSKFGSYSGTGNSDGPMIFTSFKPAWIMIKGYAGTDDWIVMDNKRSGYNSENEYLDANNSTAESDGSGNIDFLSNGFKIRSTFSSLNYVTGEYIYMAFAETPFKYALAR